MERSLRTLLTGIVDYAGLFPPAELPLEEAIREYAGTQTGPAAWLLSRFVCPADRLSDFGPLGDKAFTADKPARLTVLGREDPLTPEFIKDVRLADYFAKTHGERCQIEALELRVPGDKLRDWTPEAVSEGLDVLATRLLEHHFADAEVFLEPIFVGEYRESLARTIAALQFHDEQRGRPAPARIGLKLRTGGVQATAFPPLERVAHTLIACRDGCVPLKFTAGLHHPLRHFDAGLQTDMHGFINVFTGAVLAHARGLNEETLTQLLAEQDAAAFTFTAEGFQWREWSATIDEIELARREFALSFGSCSLNEPQEGLSTLGLM
ncbi:MAG: hypothetical protein PVJ57_04900 [Phycisphaerae bacterium]|jgi:hypothetical protein